MRALSSKLRGDLAAKRNSTTGDSDPRAADISKFVAWLDARTNIDLNGATTHGAFASLFRHFADMAVPLSPDMTSGTAAVPDKELRFAESGVKKITTTAPPGSNEEFLRELAQDGMVTQYSAESNLHVHALALREFTRGLSMQEQLTQARSRASSAVSELSMGMNYRLEEITERPWLFSSICKGHNRFTEEEASRICLFHPTASQTENQGSIQRKYKVQSALQVTSVGELNSGPVDIIQLGSELGHRIRSGQSEPKLLGQGGTVLGSCTECNTVDAFRKMSVRGSQLSAQVSLLNYLSLWAGEGGGGSYAPLQSLYFVCVLCVFSH